MVIFSCKKKDVLEPEPKPVPEIPMYIKYDISKDTAYFVNNFSTERKIRPDTCKYLVMCQYPDSSFVVAFLQHDTGIVYLQGGYSTTYAVVRSDRDLQGLHLELKFGKGYDDLTIVPGLVTDTTSFITIKTKFNNRSIIISGEDVRRKGYFSIYYDKFL
jgi:hypothetical protein